MAADRISNQQVCTFRGNISGEVNISASGTRIFKSIESVNVRESDYHGEDEHYYADDPGI